MRWDSSVLARSGRYQTVGRCLATSHLSPLLFCATVGLHGERERRSARSPTGSLPALLGGRLGRGRRLRVSLVFRCHSCHLPSLSEVGIHRTSSHSACGGRAGTGPALTRRSLLPLLRRSTIGCRCRLLHRLLGACLLGSHSCHLPSLCEVEVSCYRIPSTTRRAHSSVSSKASLSKSSSRISSRRVNQLVWMRPSPHFGHVPALFRSRRNRIVAPQDGHLALLMRPETSCPMLSSLRNLLAC